MNLTGKNYSKKEFRDKPGSETDLDDSCTKY